MASATSRKTKSNNAFRSIGEAARELELPTHVLRFWETKFSALEPVKRPDGRRMYRPKDLDALRAIKALLHDQGLTIKGAQKVLSEQGVTTVLQGEAKLICEVPNIVDPALYDSPAANPVQRLQKTVNDVVESGVFQSTDQKSADRLTDLLTDLDAVKARLDAVLVKNAA